MLLNSRGSLDLLTLSRTALLIAANLFFADRAAAQGVIGWGRTAYRGGGTPGSASNGVIGFRVARAPHDYLHSLSSFLFPLPF